MGLTNLRPGSANKESSGRGNFERKFDKKLRFYAKVRDTVVSLAARKEIGKKKRLRSRQKKMKAYDLSTLGESLPELSAPQKLPHAINSKLNCKSRQRLVEKESKRLAAVLNHPSFQLDPLSAIHHHLESTQPIQESSNQKKPLGKTRKEKAKRKKTKHPSGTRSMDL
ncbi:ribosome biogenesis protein [Tasmannia lanceolata]|uniref:ribosome biogenesis protein n=1 Tax=Tasmannia lanceolata TaxID=3420 RepID=UPI004064540A